MNLNNFKDELAKYVLDENNYEVGTVLGQGAFGFVYEGIELLTNTVVAIKQVNIDAMGAHSWDCITKQISVLFQCQHPSIIPLRGFYYNEQQNKLSIVMPIFKTDLLAWLRECHRRLENLPESEKKNIEEALIQVIYQIASAEAYLINNFSIVHRDIKPENILVGDDNNQFVLTDFDICEKISQEKHMIIGAKAFFPPEITAAIQKDEKYAEFDLEKADVFALGSVALEIISHQFYLMRIDKCRQNQTIIKQELDKSTIISKDIKELLASMLEIDPVKRLKFGEVVYQIEQIIDKKKQNATLGPNLESENENLKAMIMNLLDQKKSLLVSNTELDEQCKNMEVYEIDEEEELIFENYYQNEK